MAKQLKSYKLNDATLAQIAALARCRNGNATAVIEIAVDRMYQQEGNVNKGTVVSARVIRRGNLHTHDVIVRLVSDPERLHTYTQYDYLDRVLEYGIESQDNATAIADRALGTTQDARELLAGGVEYYGDTCVYVTTLKPETAV